ncbi:hypothetical protein DTO195F2_3705 [Paecilomyces variotii]|nr:hypothetical protein DTO195F2_3705 [Paecilomyces variotii]KAJ9369643.1 hypothetical protein DTO282E5_5616 [Paecilomyces variotii]
MAVSKGLLGTQWRSSRTLVIACISVALFSDTFLYSFIVPILSSMLKDRLYIDPIHTQFYITVVLALYAFTSLIASPIIGHFANRKPSRKKPLLLSLILSLVGTVLFACSHSLWIFFFARILQGIAASATWVIGLATIADRVSEDDIGKVMGTVNSFISAGFIVGPVVSGFLFEALGYWPTWAAPFGVLMLDFIARLLMVVEKSDKEVPARPPSSYSSSSSSSFCSSKGTIATPSSEATEDRTLLSETGSSYHSFPESIQTQDPPDDLTPTPPRSFYRDYLNKSRVLTALLISSLSIFISSTLDTTLPLHVQEAFNWGTSATGLMFFCLQASTLVISPLSGWLYDVIGPKYPITISLVCLIPLIWVLGIPGAEQFPSANGEIMGPTLYITAVIGIGAIMPFINGIGMLELTAVVKERQVENPQVYGPNSGSARAYALNGLLVTLAMMAGPIISGTLHGTVGYYYMNSVFAIALIPLPILSFLFLGKKYPRQARGVLLE